MLWVWGRRAVVPPGEVTFSRNFEGGSSGERRMSSPEPSTVALLLAGVAAVGGIARRRARGRECEWVDEDDAVARQRRSSMFTTTTHAK